MEAGYLERGIPLQKQEVKNKKTLNGRIDSRGVSFDNACKKWRAYTCKDKKIIRYGCFETKEEAMEVAKRKRKELDIKEFDI